MLKDNLQNRLRSIDLIYFSTIIIMVVMPFRNKYLPPAVILLFIAWFFEYYSKFKELISPCSKYKTLFTIFILFYLWQIITIVYTSNVKMGWSIIFSRISLIVFPLIFFNPSFNLKINISRLLRIFAISTTLYIISCFGYALYRSLSINNGMISFYPHPLEYDWVNYFFGPDFTYSIHPSYMAMYVLLSVFISFESWYDSSLKMKFRFGWIIIGVFLLMSVYFISSRAAIMAVLLMLPLYALNKMIKFKRSRLVWISAVIILVLSLPLMRKNDRVNNFLTGFSFQEKTKPQNQDERFTIWKCAVKLIRENPLLGVGIGDARKEMVKEYERLGEEKMVRERLNSHNQFLEVTLEGGIIALIFLMIVLGYMTFIALSENNLIYGMFILMMFIFFMFESILYRLAGITFFSCFSFLLLHFSINKNDIH